MNLIPEPDERTRQRFEIEAEIETRLDTEYRQLDKRIAGYLDAMQRAIDDALEDD